MDYKNYQAVVEFDAEDRIFTGRVVNTNDVIVFDGTSVDELEVAFHTAIDQYLQDCEALGKNPDKPFSGRFNLRIAPPLHRQIVMRAEQQGLSLNTFIERVLTEAIAR
jgi:predicted HicB family RNase H-like nuclease